MNNDTTHDSPARSGQATGYATAVDAALAWFDASYRDSDAIDDARQLGHADNSDQVAVSVTAGQVLAAEVLRLRGVIAACEEQHTADAEAIRALRNALRDASEEPNIDRARAIADAVLCGESHNARELSDGRTKTNPNT